MPVYCSCTCWTLGGSRNAFMKKNLSILPSSCQSGCFLGIGSLGVSEFGMVLEIMLCVITEPDFLGKLFLPPKLGKWTKNRPKKGFWNLKTNLVINFHWIGSIVKTLLFAVFLHKSYIGKNLVLWDIGQNGLSQSDCRIFKSTISHEINRWNSLILCMLIQIQKNDKLIENLVVEHSKKWVWSIWSLGSKFSCISRMNRWNELIFCMLAQIHTNWKVIENFWGEHGQKLVWSCWLQDSKTDVSEDWADGKNWFFAYWYRFTKIKKLIKSFMRWHGQKWVWTVWLRNSKIDCIS